MEDKKSRLDKLSKLMDLTDQDVDEFVTLVDMLEEGTLCELDHGPEDPTSHPEIDMDPNFDPDYSKPRKAVQCIVQKMGDMATGVVYDEIRIPICQECTETLTDPKEVAMWVLIYCFQCGSNHWVLRELSLRSYPKEPIYWVDSCVECWDPTGEKRKNLKPVNIIPNDIIN